MYVTGMKGCLSRDWKDEGVLRGEERPRKGNGLPEERRAWKRAPLLCQPQTSRSPGRLTSRFAQSGSLPLVSRYRGSGETHGIHEKRINNPIDKQVTYIKTGNSPKTHDKKHTHTKICSNLTVRKMQITQWDIMFYPWLTQTKKLHGIKYWQKCGRMKDLTLTAGFGGPLGLF